MSILGVVFTVGISLEQWVKQGLIYREKLIYEEHLRQNHFDKVIWFTYGKKDAVIREELVKNGVLDSRIEIVPMPKYFIGKRKAYLYSKLLPYIQRKYCKELSIIKSNQMGGAWCAEKIHEIYGIPFELRTGYTYSIFLKKDAEGAEKEKDKKHLLKEYIKYRSIENVLYHTCDFATVSSDGDKAYICKEYGIAPEKILVLPNYIDCDLFTPKCEIEKNSSRFVFVGRMSKQKNLFNTITAVCEAGFGLDIYGKGELEDKLREHVELHGYDVRFMGVVENRELPLILNGYKYYILASEYEGMPKTLLEAMACGLVCFGTDVLGIGEVIKDNYNGYLISDVSVEKIKAKIQENILKKENSFVAENARKYICEKYSMSEIVRMEWELVKSE